MIQRLYGRPSTRVVRILVSVLGVVATAGQTISLVADDEDVFAIGMVVILVVNAVIGLIAGLRTDPYSNPASTDPGDAKALSVAMSEIFWVLLIAIGVQIVLGFLQSIVVCFADAWDEPSMLLSPLLFAGLVGTGGALAGLLVALLVVWPVVKLVQTIARLATGRAVVPGAAPLSLLLIATVLAAVFTVFAPHAETSGTPKGRGLALIIGVWFTYTGDTQDQVFAWIARGLQLVIAATLVWLVLELRANKKRKAAEQ